MVNIKIFYLSIGLIFYLHSQKRLIQTSELLDEDKIYSAAVKTDGAVKCPLEGCKYNKKFVITIPSYNNEKWYKNNLSSVFSQTYQNFRIIYIDDCSPDNTYRLVENYVKELKKSEQVTLIRNERRQGALANHFKAINLCADDEIVVCLDGDDWFANDNVLEYLNKIYQDSSIWLTYGQFNNWPTNAIGWCENYPLEVIRKNEFREFGFVAAQARTYYAWLAKQVKLCDLLCDLKDYEGKFFPASGDVALMFPMLEMARNNFKFIPEVLIQRNVATELNDFKIHADLQINLTSVIRKKEKYKYVEKPIINFNRQDKKADLIIFSYDRPMQLYALLESMEKYVKGLDNITVIYRTSNDDFETGYAELKERFFFIKFISQGFLSKEDFKPLVLGTILSSPNEHILFSVDDIVVKDFVDISECINVMKKTHAYGFYLRLGKNITYCYIEDRQEEIPFNTQIDKNIYAWQFKFGQSDWGFPTSVDMTIFNKNEILDEVKNLNFNSPNTLEAALYNKFVTQNRNFDKVGLFFENSKIINNPTNIVQIDYPDFRNMNLFSKYQLLEKFKSGMKIDISDFDQIENNSPHMECELKFIKRDKPLKYDLTLIGSVNFSGGITRIPIIFIDLLKDKLNINFINTIPYNLQDIANDVRNIILNNAYTAGNVSILTDILWYPIYCKSYNLVPDSKIKISYSMLESTKIPQAWVNILNDKFDAVVVPDEFLIEVYKKSGVKIPIFVLPLPVRLEEFLKKPKKCKPNIPFRFGLSAENNARKNFDLVIDAFQDAFGNSNNVTLKIHSKDVNYLANLRQKLKEKKATNIELIEKVFSWQEYIEFISSLDCYTFLSKGEGFSITPRESLAAGVPCILSNNTAHKIICDSGHVLAVKSDILEDAYYKIFNQTCGYHFNCKINDVTKALKEVYRNYKFYLDKAQAGREWVKQYLPENLQLKYLNLVKPKKVIYGKDNKITNEYLMTNSNKLYKKYLELV